MHKRMNTVDGSTQFAGMAPAALMQRARLNTMVVGQDNSRQREHQRLRVLLVEDSEQDALLLQLQLKQAAWEADCKRVHSEKTMRAALEDGEWDLVISDYVLPGFSGMRALSILQQMGRDIPFIVVSGMIGEETAVAAMKAGAHDYLMKDNLARLIPAIERELREAETRRARRLADEKLKVEHSFRKTIENSIPSGLAVMDLNGTQTYVNPSFCAMVGWSEAELVGLRPPFPYWPVEQRKQIEESYAMAINGQAPREGFELQFQRKDGTLFDALVLVGPLLDAQGHTTGWVRSVTDITQRKSAEAALRRANETLESRVKERTEELTRALANLREEIRHREKLADELVELADEQRVLNVIELHDDLGQSLAGMAMGVKGLEMKARSGQAIDAEELQKIFAQFEIITGAQNASTPMQRPSMTGKDLLTALKGLVRFFKNDRAVACSFKSKGMIPPLPEDYVVHLYRIALEAMANAVKHGRAKRITVGIAAETKEMVLTIRSNGRPFPDIEAERSGMGLRLMHYRASLLKAAMDVRAGARGGTVVTCSVPLPDSNPS